MAYNHPNLAVRYLAEHGERLDEYEGMCGELVDALLHWLGEEPDIAIVWFEPPFGHALIPDSDWRYHSVLEYGGLIHCAWFPDVIESADDYNQEVFGGRAVYTRHPTV